MLWSRSICWDMWISGFCDHFIWLVMDQAHETWLMCDVPAVFHDVWSLNYRTAAECIFLQLVVLANAFPSKKKMPYVAMLG